MKQRTKRWLAGTLVIVAALWFCFVGYIGWAMRQPPEVFGRVMSRMPMPAYFLFPFETMWSQARKAHLSVGDEAPDLTVKTLETKTPVQWSSLWMTKPVVLVLGSYT